MAKYLVLYRSSISAEEQMAGSNPEATQAGMELWMNWAGRAGGAIADMGSPVRPVGTVGPSGPGGSTSPDVGGFSILEAASAEEVHRLLTDHPHFHAGGDPFIEVLEFLSLPGM